MKALFHAANPDKSRAKVFPCRHDKNSSWRIIDPEYLKRIENLCNHAVLQEAYFNIEHDKNGEIRLPLTAYFSVGDEQTINGSLVAFFDVTPQDIEKDEPSLWLLND